jgi:hypothetical protein
MTAAPDSDGDVDWTSLSARASMASHRLIGWIYWDPRAVSSYKALGFDEGGTYYINSRCAPLAPAGADVVAAACYSILPAFIAVSLRLGAERSDFATITRLRDGAVLAGLRDYVPEICDALTDLGPRLWAAADALTLSGRPMFAAHRQAPRSDDPLLSAWLAVNCIREWRGDTHFAVLAAENISGVQAGILHNAFLNYPDQWIPRSRGADDAALAEAMSDLESRQLALDGHVNDSGLALRHAIEDRTDQICTQPWRLLGAQGTLDFLDVVEPVGDRLLRRIDETAGTEWMPAARPRRH